MSPLAILLFSAHVCLVARPGSAEIYRGPREEKLRREFIVDASGVLAAPDDLGEDVMSSTTEIDRQRRSAGLLLQEQDEDFLLLPPGPRRSRRSAGADRQELLQVMDRSGSAQVGGLQQGISIEEDRNALLESSTHDAVFHLSSHVGGVGAAAAGPAPWGAGTGAASLDANAPGGVAGLGNNSYLVVDGLDDAATDLLAMARAGRSYQGNTQDRYEGASAHERGGRSSFVEELSTTSSERRESEDSPPPVSAPKVSAKLPPTAPKADGSCQQGYSPEAGECVSRRFVHPRPGSASVGGYAPEAGECVSRRLFVRGRGVRQ